MYVNAASVAANFVRGGYERVVVVALTRDGSAALPGELVDANGLTPEQVADRIGALL